MLAELGLLALGCIVFSCYATLAEMYADWWRETHPKKEQEP